MTSPESTISNQELQQPLELDAIAHKHGHGHDEEDHSMLGFIIFLLSESVIFLSFFAGYIVYKTTIVDWLPPGVEGLEVREPAINTVVLVSSSFVIYIAEKYLHNENLWGFRVFWADYIFCLFEQCHCQI